MNCKDEAVVVQNISNKPHDRQTSGGPRHYRNPSLLFQPCQPSALLLNLTVKYRKGKGLGRVKTAMLIWQVASRFAWGLIHLLRLGGLEGQLKIARHEGHQ